MHRSPATGPDRRPAEGDVARTFDHLGVRISVAGGTRIGNRYPANFDVLHVDRTTPFLAVADGMGGGEGSAVAGSTAMTTFVAAVRAVGTAIGPEHLRAAVEQAQNRVRDAGNRLGELTGCTLTALITGPAGPAAWSPGSPTWNAPTTMWNPTVRSGPPRSRPGWIVQLGDSRAYRLRDGRLELLTVDHTEAWLGTLHGWYPAGSPEANAARYRLTRYVGHPDSPEPDLLNVSLLPGDVYCVCTDGVTDEIGYAVLARRLATDADPIKIVHGLLVDALAAGGRDNATLAVLRVEAR
nr:serine/threonine-protein phosphatase [Micromonospora sp. DSM 115978]